MKEQYVRLADHAIFKSRYGQWQLIHTRKRERERLLIEESGAEVVLSLLSGDSIRKTRRSFGLSKKELHAFLKLLTKEGVVEFRDDSCDSRGRCYAVEPPLDGINIFVTNACNLRCEHCYIEGGRRMSGELDGATWIEVLKQAQKLGAFRVNVTGGEPLLHKDFLEIAEYIASVPTFNANLNTNGTLIKEGSKGLLARAFTSVQISIDDAVAEKHDAFRGSKGCFEKSVWTIKQLVASGIEVNVGFSLTSENFLALDGVIELCENLGVNALGIGLVAPVGRAKTNNLVPLSSVSLHENDFINGLYQKLRTLSERSTRLKILLPFRIHQDKEFSTQEKRYICDGDNKQTLYVLADGTAMPCDKLPRQVFGCGNIKEMSLIDVWMSQKMRAFKLTSPRDLPKCRDCPHLKICGGACVARAFHTGGLLESPDWASCVVVQKLAHEQRAAMNKG